MTTTIRACTAAAIETFPGRKHYALFAAGKHGPRDFPDNVVQCVAFGTQQSVWRWIFSQAAQCSLGRIETPRGLVVQPEHYVEAWRIALAEPRLLFDQPLALSPRFEDGELCVYHDGLLLSGCLDLIEGGPPPNAQHIAAALRAGTEVTLGLIHGIDFISVLFGFWPPAPNVPPNLVCPSHESRAFPELAPQALGSKISNPVVSFDEVPGTATVVLRATIPPTHCVGQREAAPLLQRREVCILGEFESVLVRYMTEVAAECEVAWPRGGSDALAAFSDAVMLRRGVVDPAAFIGIAERAVRDEGDLRKLDALSVALHPTYTVGGVRAFQIGRAKECGMLGTLSEFPGAAMRYLPADSRFAPETGPARPN